MDSDYSVFSLLPPYNNLRAQVMQPVRGSQPASVTYEATEDTRGSVNCTSATKTNFWTWVLPLFGSSPAMDVGLAGNYTPGRTPAGMALDPARGCWKADGIPIVPCDDAGQVNYYPMVRVVARDGGGSVLGETRTVLPVSNEMSCIHCHASVTGDPAAQPATGWVNDPSTEKDWRRNILKLHDDRNVANPLYAQALGQVGYQAGGLLATSDAGTPVLCARCHASNALGTTGVAGVKQLTTAVHSWHAVHAMDDNTGLPLDNTTNRTACYYCHPGSTTQCLRGVMGNAKDAQGNMLIQCQGCHGSMSKVGAAGRAGWVDLPSCQQCHYPSSGTGSYVRDVTVFDASGNPRQTDSIFAASGLYKTSAGHGGLQCEACHGPTHAEWPSSEANDNVQSIALQGYAGKIVECTACHASVPLTADGGPHGLHTIGQNWVDGHGPLARSQAQHCTTCHGNDGKGTILSRTSTARDFVVGLRRVSFSAGHTVSCTDCHTQP